MKVLIINCGSSSLKFQLIDSDSEKCLAKGLCERIGIEGSMITYAPEGGEKEKTVTRESCDRLTFLMARPGGFEPPAKSLEGSCSIHLSYERVLSL